MRRTSPLFFACALLATAASGLPAQPAFDEPGFWIGVGAGAGSAAVDCAGCQDSRATALAGHIRFGGTVRRRFQVGVELSRWQRDEGSVDEEIQVGSADIRYVPGVFSGFALRMGLGYTEYSARHRQEDFAADVRTEGWTILAGIAYSIRVSPSVSLDPYLSYSRQLDGEMQLSTVGTGERALADLLQLGLGLTWHQGARD